MKFTDYNIAPELKQNLQQQGFKRPTDIQYKAIPSIMRGEDVLAIAHTGTGKTAAFAIPVIDKIHTSKRSKRNYGIQCIVMVPTRELAQQIGTVFNKLCKHTRVKALAIYGGVDQDHQIDRLTKGVDILIATPGRMFDLISQNVISLEKVQTLILDEADRMLDSNFIQDIKAIKQKIRRRHQTLFFSATINEKIKKLAYSQVKTSAIRIQISPNNPVSKNIFHFVMFIKMDDKRFFLERFILENPNSKILVFVRTKVRAERVSKAMSRVGIETLTLHGDKDQEKRTATMQQFKAGIANILIATDVTARGIDIPNVNFVINYDLPEIAEYYVHRVGRTGRGRQKGIAVSFCSEREKQLLADIHKFINKKIEVIHLTKKDYHFTRHPEEMEFPILDVLIDSKTIFKRKKTAKKKRKKKKKK